MTKCRICDRETKEVHKHHVVPRSRGGRHKKTIECCGTCINQVHMLFSNKELERMTLEELLETEQIQKYKKWIAKKPGNYSTKLSTRVKRKRRL